MTTSRPCLPTSGLAAPTPIRHTPPGSQTLRYLGGPFGDFDTEPESTARTRRLLMPIFSPRRMTRLNDRIAALVEIVLDELAEQTTPTDLHERLSLPLPVMVICEL